MDKDTQGNLQKRRKHAWDIATTVCLQTKEDPVTVYEWIMKSYEEIDANKRKNQTESIESY